MPPTPATDLRTNHGTWVIPTHRLPAVTAAMLDTLPHEAYDPDFRGQSLTTTYFDDPDYTLRKARADKRRYMTLRVRCYKAAGQVEAYALNAKTESEKFRLWIGPNVADGILDGTLPIVGQLPAYLAARLNELSAGPLAPVVSIHCHRYAVEDDQDRLTLDVGVCTDRHKPLVFGVLEYKAVKAEGAPEAIAALRLARLKISKFLWATEV